MKKLFAMALVLVMVLSMVPTAFAVDINFTGGAKNAEYSAYKLLNVTDGGDGKYAYTLNEKYTAVLQTVTGKTTQKEIIDYISALDDDALNAFTEALYDELNKEGAVIAPDYTTKTDKIENAAPGYYLIAETKMGDDINGIDDTSSLYPLNTPGNTSITVTTKESVPTVNKKVQNLDDSTGDTLWGEHADYDIGDTIPYTITGTVSGKYEDYKNYRYQFIDTMSDGLTLNQDSIVITIGHEDVTEHFDIETTEHSFTAIADLKVLDEECPNVTILHNTVIVVTYTATLNENAKTGQEGNENKVILKFENDPYAEYDGEPDMPPPPPPGETPPDVNIVFTFEGVVNKVDKNGNALAGAGFTLYKFFENDNEWKKIGDEITGVTTFSFKGLDVGEYKLVETTVPDGYNKADDIEFKIVATYDTTKDPIELIGLQVQNSMGDIISQVSVADIDADDPIAQADNATFITNVAVGTVTTDVINHSGAELPSTGGMGTTLFYAIGGIMVLAAVVLLITKKRMVTAK